MSNKDLRATLARAALKNASLMKGVTSPREAVCRALSVADAMIKALRSSAKSPPIIKQLTAVEMQQWENVMKNSLQFQRTRYARSTRETQVEVPPKERNLT